MTEIALYDTLTRKKQPLRPLDPANVRMYVCGPTVYDRAHIGNARPAVVFDVLFRLLRHRYGDDQVTYVRNITDVDDKINARAAATGRSIREITDETTLWFHEDMAALGNLPPTHEPRATEYIRPMVAMIERLIARGHAYPAEGHVLFAVASYADYGTLARRSLDEMRAGARVEVAPYKRDPMDFVLWKPSAAGEPGWDSPWGRGRPGWHIECSAMARELLGESFDIHGGGIDLVFPHHENERAQSMCAHPEGRFASIWMHNGFLQVEGEKMSKSLGNFFTVRDLLDRGVPGQVMRFVLLSTHYTQPLDWTDAKVREASVHLAQWQRILREARRVGVTSDATGVSPANAIVAALADDLNTPLVIKHLRELAREAKLGKPQPEESVARFKASLALIGINPVGHQDTAIRNSIDSAFDAVGWTGEDDLTLRVDSLLHLRERARLDRDFGKADAIRDGLVAAGIKVMDAAGEKTRWEVGPGFDPQRLAEIEA